MRREVKNDIEIVWYILFIYKNGKEEKQYLIESWTEREKSTQPGVSMGVKHHWKVTSDFALSEPNSTKRAECLPLVPHASQEDGDIQPFWTLTIDAGRSQPKDEGAYACNLTEVLDTTRVKVTTHKQIRLKASVVNEVQVHKIS